MEPSAEIKQLLEQLQSSDNDLRQNAEKLLEQASKQPNELTTELLKCISFLPPPNNQFACVLLRRLLIGVMTGDVQTDTFWKNLTIKETLANSLLEGFAKVRRMGCWRGLRR
jgi:hypothetical protein